MTTPAMQPTSSASSADERAKFEAWHKGQFTGLDYTTDADGNYLDELTQLDWARYQRCKKAIVPQVVQAPSDEDVIELAGDFIFDAVGKTNLLRFARALLTTTSNAGVAAPIVPTVPSEQARVLVKMHEARADFNQLIELLGFDAKRIRKADGSVDWALLADGIKTRDELAAHNAEPDAYMQIGLPPMHDGERFPRIDKPASYNSDWWQFKPLYYAAPSTAEQASDAWKPPETAPVGEEILVVATLYSKIYPDPQPQRVVAKKDSGNCWWAGPIPLSHVTKWMRLPEDEVQP